MRLIDFVKELFERIKESLVLACKGFWRLPVKRKSGKAIQNLSLLRQKGAFGFITYQVRWKQEDGTFRMPEETTAEFAYPGSFTVAGKTYASLKELWHKEIVLYNPVWYDIYGRMWIQVAQEYPCFDDSDWESECRFYRWFYLIEGDKLFCVYRDDGLEGITVTEDVAKLQQSHVEEMVSSGWLIEGNLEADS